MDSNSTSDRFPQSSLFLNFHLHSHKTFVCHRSFQLQTSLIVYSQFLCFHLHTTLDHLQKNSPLLKYLSDNNMIRVPKVSVYDPANLYTVCSLTTEYSS